MYRLPCLKNPFAPCIKKIYQDFSCLDNNLSFEATPQTNTPLFFIFISFEFLQYIKVK